VSRRLRPVAAGDLAALAAVHAQSFPEEHWDARAIEELLGMAGASGHLVEAAEDGRVLGFILDLILAGEAEILTLAVAPASRRQGVARQLLADLAGRAKHGGARSIGLEVAADNPAARQLYETSGFVAAGRRRGYYRRGRATIDALLFRRMLLP
jgi:ribosomal-protein-alanine N-acetyltransferase